MSGIEFGCLLMAVLAAGAVVGIAVAGFLDTVIDGHPETSALSDSRASGSADGAPPASDPPIEAGGVFQTPEKR